MTGGRPSWGVVPQTSGARVKVWAPDARQVELVIERGRGVGERRTLEPTGDGNFGGVVDGLETGDWYRLSLDGGPLWPDPASRFQPLGVHGPSEVVDPSAFDWTDAEWAGVPLERLALYEMHLGTFTPEGTLEAAARRLEALRDLGVTAVELMPLADFPGDRNWGYDGAALFAPARRYGSPDDLRRFVDRAHGLGLAVHLDVVYNHFGPDGAYAAGFSRKFFSDRHRSPWGDGINLDGPGSDRVRSFFIENALHWICEYHVDGLRLDATHAMMDDGPLHFLAELAAKVRALASPRSVLLVAEDARNLACIVTPASEGGWGLDAVWSDDFHHALRVHLTGERDGYFVDFHGSTDEIAAILRRGWLYCGEPSRWWGAPRGTVPVGIPPERFVIFTQNHDQVGNRAMGDRLHHQISLDAYRAITALHLLAPQTPLIFMGQEWAATSPFRFFTDHEPELGRKVTAGRREEFRRFAAFSDPARREAIPDPQAPETFEASRLRWEERDREPHAGTRRWFADLLALRWAEAARRPASPLAWGVGAAGDDAVWLRRGDLAGPGLCVVARLRGSGSVALGADALPPEASAWELERSSEEPRYATDPAPPRLEREQGRLCVHFARPGAALLRRRDPSDG